MVLIPANIYPPITMIDFPSRFVEVPPSTQVPATLVHVWVRDKAEQNRKMAFSLFESLLQPSSDAPFALGTSEPTLLDVFMSTFAHYSPRPRWVIWRIKGIQHIPHLIPDRNGCKRTVHVFMLAVERPFNILFLERYLFCKILNAAWCHPSERVEEHGTAVW